MPLNLRRPALGRLGRILPRSAERELLSQNACHVTILIARFHRPSGVHMNRSLLIAISLSLTAASQAAFFSLNSPTVGPNQPGTFYVTGTVTVGSGESVISPNLVSTVALPFLSNYSAGFNFNCGNFDTDFLNWNGVTNYTGKILDFTVNPGNLGYSGGMPLGVYASNVLFPGGAGVALDYLDAAGAEHTMRANYHINVETTPEPATLLCLGLGAVVTLRRRRR